MSDLPWFELTYACVVARCPASLPPPATTSPAIAGVSQPTVSRALRDDPRLSDETRQRVQEAARELHYVPSQRGRSLATQSTGQIGIVVSDLGNPFYLQVLDALHHELHQAGLRMLVLTPDDDNRVPLERVVDGSLDGVILTTTQLHSTLPAELSRRGFPFVLLNREIDDAPGDVCVVDNVEGARLIAQELLELGHTRHRRHLRPRDHQHRSRPRGELSHGAGRGRRRPAARALAPGAL